MKQELTNEAYKDEFPDTFKLVDYLIQKARNELHAKNERFNLWAFLRNERKKLQKSQ